MTHRSYCRNKVGILRDALRKAQEALDLTRGLSEYTHDEDCACSGDTVEHSKDCKNCECQNFK